MTAGLCRHFCRNIFWSNTSRDHYRTSTFIFFSGSRGKGAPKRCPVLDERNPIRSELQTVFSPKQLAVCHTADIWNTEWYLKTDLILSWCVDTRKGKHSNINQRSRRYLNIQWRVSNFCFNLFHSLLIVSKTLNRCSFIL